MSNGKPTVPGAKAHTAFLERLAIALSSYPDLEVNVRTDGPAPCLTARNIAVPVLSETVTIADTGDDLAYFWSWGRAIGNAGDLEAAAHAIAYVLTARDAQLNAVARHESSRLDAARREARNERNGDV